MGTAANVGDHGVDEGVHDGGVGGSGQAGATDTILDSISSESPSPDLIGVELGQRWSVFREAALKQYEFQVIHCLAVGSIEATKIGFDHSLGSTAHPHDPVGDALGIGAKTIPGKLLEMVG